jgi:hypothetical protein
MISDGKPGWAGTTASRPIIKEHSLLNTISFERKIIEPLISIKVFEFYEEKATENLLSVAFVK